MDDVTFSRFDAADYLKTEEDVAGYLAAVAEEDDPTAMVVALGAVARARNTAALARKVGVSREGLYRSFSAKGNPSFSTVAKVANAMGYQVTFRPVDGGGATRIRKPAPGETGAAAGAGRAKAKAARKGGDAGT